MNLKRLEWWASVVVVVCLKADIARAAEKALPSADEVIKHAVERSEKESQNDIDFKQRYFFVFNKLTEIRNMEGELKKSYGRNSTNNPSKAVVAPKPKPKPEPEPEPEQAVTPVVVRSPKDEQFASSSVGKATARKFDRNQFQFNDDLIGRYDFKMVGREVTNGYSLLVLDFAPKKKKLPESGIKDRLINRVAGRVWVDEREYAIKECKIHLVESLSILGGIVGEAQKFDYCFDRERTEGGLWYVRTSSWNLEGREVIVHRRAEYRESRTEVRKGE